MIRRKLSLNIFLNLLVLASFSEAKADSILSNLQYSARVRPLAIAYGIPGAEFFVTTSEGYFIGPTVHFYSEHNYLRNSSMDSTEVGVKFGRIFPSGVEHQGWFVMGNLNYLNIRQDSYYALTAQTFNNKMNLLYEAVFVGFQFNSLIFGPNAWDLRLGMGMVNREAASKTFTASNGEKVPVGVRERLDPTLEFTVGYVF